MPESWELLRNSPTTIQEIPRCAPTGDPRSWHISDTTVHVLLLARFLSCLLYVAPKLGVIQPHLRSLHVARGSLHTLPTNSVHGSVGSYHLRFGTVGRRGSNRRHSLHFERLRQFLLDESYYLGIGRALGSIFLFLFLGSVFIALRHVSGSIYALSPSDK